MKKRMFIMLLSVVLVVAGIAWFKYQDIQKQMADGAAMMSVPFVVSTSPATVTQWSEYKQAVGTIRAEKGVDIASEVSGLVQKIAFNSGQDVKEGDLLIQLRADEDQARLQTLEANAKLAEINYARNKKQAAVQAVSQAEMDSSAAALAVAKASVNEQLALIEKKNIRAPFSGKVGIRAVDLGQYITPGVSIVTLQALDTVYLDFTMPQQDVLNIKVGQKLSIRTDAFPDKTFEGEITAINSKVEMNTRNVYVRASMSNPDKTLLPGMFATGEIAVSEPKQFVTLPQTAITYNPYGSTVYVVDEQKEEGSDKIMKVARQVIVSTGQTRGDQVAITSGVKEGDVVVVSGQVKIRNGARLEINNKVLPSNDKNPQPEDK